MAKKIRASKFNEQLGKTLVGSRLPQGRSSISRFKRWRCNLLPDSAVALNTKSEAIAWFKEQLGVDRLPANATIEAF